MKQSLKKETSYTNNNALIFDVERFAIHDGPGIRTIIFFKGCNLDCIWCSNPESMSLDIEFGYKPESCARCFNCVDSCKIKNIVFTNDRIKIIDSSKCVNCESCIKNCPNNAIIKYGRYYDACELFEIVKKDVDFFKNSGGGITLSGGEPLLQINFLEKFLSKCKELEINTAIETAGNLKYEYFKKINKYVDLYLFDIKILNLVDTGMNKKMNIEEILNNVLMLDKDGKEVILRRIMIKNFNDSELEIKNLFDFAKKLKKLKSIHFLPFHELGCIKYNWLGRPYYNKFRTYNKKELAIKIKEIRKINEEFNLKAVFGGLE